MAASGIDGLIDGGSVSGGGGGGDTTPPVISNVTPTPGVAPGQPGGFSANPQVARSTAIQFDVVDASPGLAAVIIFARFNDTAGTSQPTFVVHNGTRFLPPFATGSLRTGNATAGYHFAVLMDGGWPGAVHWDAVAIDGNGNITGGLPA